MPQAILTVGPAVATRVAAALGKVLNLTDGNGQPRSATMSEYEDWLRDVTRRMVQGQERRDAQDAVPGPAEVAIT